MGANYASNNRKVRRSRTRKLELNEKPFEKPVKPENDDAKALLRYYKNMKVWEKKQERLKEEKEAKEWLKTKPLQKPMNSNSNFASSKKYYPALLEKWERKMIERGYNV